MAVIVMLVLRCPITTIIILHLQLSLLLPGSAHTSLVDGANDWYWCLWPRSTCVPFPWRTVFEFRILDMFPNREHRPVHWNLSIIRMVEYSGWPVGYLVITAHPPTHTHMSCTVNNGYFPCRSPEFLLFVFIMKKYLQLCQCAGQRLSVASGHHRHRMQHVLLASNAQNRQPPSRHANHSNQRHYSLLSPFPRATLEATKVLNTNLARHHRTGSSSKSNSHNKAKQSQRFFRSILPSTFHSV